MPDSAVIGRYWPGSSPLHRMDARVKLVLLLAFIVAAFIVGEGNFWGWAFARPSRWGSSPWPASL